MTAIELREKVIADLKEHNWKFSTKEFDDGECVIDTDVSSDSGYFRNYEIRMVFRKWDMKMIFYIPICVPEDKRLAVADYFSRLNYVTRYSKFDIDMDSGDLRVSAVFYAAAVVADVAEVLGDGFRLADTIDKYAKGLIEVIMGIKTAKAAFEAAHEKKAPPPSEEPPPPESESEESDDPEQLTLEDLAQPKAEAKADKKAKKSGKKKGKKSEPTSDENESSVYSLEGLNLQGKIPLEKIIAAVKKFKSGKRSSKVSTPRLNILLSGAPGSGKTAFVKHLAKEVDMPLKTVKASDLLSRFSGDTEQRIAKAFSEAKANGAILFLDEIDSFLQNREQASHSWEVTQVNELLQQMEDFGGVMVGATNFAENLDKAVLRRFTYKLKLDFLTDEGKGVFFNRYFKTPLSDEERNRLNAINNLTPGDFRTVVEELYYLNENATNAERLEALEAEAEAKGKARAKIGF